MSWRRSKVPPDLDRTLAAAGKRLSRDHVTGVLIASDAIDEHTRLGHWRGEQGDFHACVRHFPAAQVCVVLRQLTPGSKAALRACALGLSARSQEEPWDWELYGLNPHLPPWWRLEGIQQLAGLVRAVWFRLPNRALRADQVLVMRRMAGAHRVLGGLSLEEWIRSGLPQVDRVVDSSSDAGVAQVRTQRPSSSWWRRWRGHQDQHDYMAWIDDDSQRLNLQEWTGTGPSLPCLRNA